MRIGKGNRSRAAAMLLLIPCMMTLPAVAFAADVAPTAPSAAAAPGANASVAGRVKALKEQYSREQVAASTAYAKATGKSDEERSKIYMDRAPKQLPYAQKAMALARQDPKDPAAADALAFIVSDLRGNNDAELAELRDEAIDLLARDHLADPGTRAAFPMLTYYPSPAGDELLKRAAASSNRDVRGTAIFWRAESLRRSAEQTGNSAKLAEAKALYQQVASGFADVKSYRGTLADAAKSNLYEMENLAIGKPAPEIEGKDANGNPLKLSDHRGKVVVLDFWGDW